MTDHAHGSCYCGKVEFQVELPSHWIGHCHCTQCQRLNGAAFVTWAGFKTDDYKISDPEQKFRIFSMEKSDRGFCSNCGSNFYFKYISPEKEPGWIYFTLANIKTDLSDKPESHIYFENRVNWFHIEDDLTKHPQI